MMKAYRVEFVGEEWCSLMHGETRGKAIAAFARAFPLEQDYIDIRTRRVPGLDDKPITLENAKAAGFVYEDEDGFPIEDENQYFFNDCRCPICKAEQGKP